MSVSNELSAAITIFLEFPANLKYYRTEFVPKDTDDVSEALLSHIAEMIQLEHGVKLDGKNYIMVMNDEEADRLERHWDEHQNTKALYISKCTAHRNNRCSAMWKYTLSQTATLNLRCRRWANHGKSRINNYTIRFSRKGSH